MHARLSVVLLAPALFLAPLQAQTVAAPTVERRPRPRRGRSRGRSSSRPGSPGRSSREPAPGRAHPGPRNWVQHARYSIDAALDPVAGRVSGSEQVTYLNHSPDTLGTVFVYLRQNVFAPGSPRRDPAPITGGVTLTQVAVNGQDYSPPDTTTGRRRGRAMAGTYLVQGTVMRLPLAAPLLPGDSVSLSFAWSYAPAPTPSDGREGREGNVFFMGYWYPQVAVYDDVSGWVTDPYLSGAEFYMDPADYDVRLTVPYGWTVGATGSLANPEEVLTPAARDSLRAARMSGRVIRMFAARPRSCTGVPADRRHQHLALSRPRRARLRVGRQQRAGVGRDPGTGQTRRNGARHGRHPLVLPAHRPRGGMEPGRGAVHPRRDRGTVDHALAISVAHHELGGRDPHRWRDGVSDDDGDAAVGRHAVARRRPDARDRAHVVPDDGGLQRDSACRGWTRDSPSTTWRRE